MQLYTCTLLLHRKSIYQATVLESSMWKIARDSPVCWLRLSKAAEGPQLAGSGAPAEQCEGVSHLQSLQQTPKCGLCSDIGSNRSVDSGSHQLVKQRAKIQVDQLAFFLIVMSSRCACSAHTKEQIMRKDFFTAYHEHLSHDWNADVDLNKREIFLSCI